jgi:hypothetical protein
MKSFQRAVLLWGVLAAVCSTDFIRAQSGAAPGANVQPNPPAAPPPGDPFIRQQQSAKNTPDPANQPAEASGPPVNLLSVIETWTLNQKDLLSLMEADGDETARYARLEGFAKSGKAKLSGLIALTSKSGQRSVVEAIDEVRYATEFVAPAAVGDIAYPAAWTTRNVGDTLEIEPVLGPNGTTIDVNLVPQTVRLAGIDEWRAEVGGVPTASLKFEAEKVVTSLPVENGRPALLATATPALAAPDAHGERNVRIQWLRVMVQKTPPPAAPGKDAGDVRIELLLYSLDRESARRILAGSADSAQSHAAVRELVGKGEAQLEVLSALVTKSGQRAVLEEQAEVTYPTQGKAPSVEMRTGSPPVRQPASWNSFETRSTGVTMEIEPVVGEDGRFVDINIVPQVVQLNGMLELGGIAAKYPSQPLFTTRKITTSATSGLGVPVLLGTMSYPRENGVNARKDDHRTFLAYVRVTPFRP